ncbi:MAG: N-acetylglucosamine-6-phosphate deacetylase [Vicinamibacterales bacterium]
MITLSGADLVLPDRVLTGGALVIEGDRIAEIITSPRRGSAGTLHYPLHNHYVVPGFIDVHVHGIEGVDSLSGADAIARMAERLPRFGVTAFCPTSIACDPLTLRQMLTAVRAARTSRPPAGARVLPAHLESNFISPDYNGAQPLECLRRPAPDDQRWLAPLAREHAWSGEDILREIADARPDVGIVTVAPELDGAIALIRDLVSNGHRVSLGHSGATYDQALAAIRAGATQATHLFNRMTPVAHRAPGLAGAALESDEITAEIICDGIHVHPAMIRVALAAKRAERIMAITDGTAGSGLAPGSEATLGGRRIHIRDAAYLDDGTIAGSVLTMDRAFAKLTAHAAVSFTDAATVCSTTPARTLGLQGFGIIAQGAAADLVVLDRDLRVVQTWIAGALAYESRPAV